MLFLLTCLGSGSALAISCAVVPGYLPSEAESAFLRSDYDRAVTLYQAQLAQKPNDPALTASLALVFLRQQNIKEAEEVIQKAIAQNPPSTTLLSALGEVQYREGEPWLAAASANAAMNLDPCYAQAHLLRASLLRLSSDYALEAEDLNAAHALDPHDPRIRLRWLESLPPEQRIRELEAYLSAGGGDDPETLKDLHFYLGYLKRQALEPHKPCRLVSNTETATIPFASLMADATHIRAFGLDVKLNDRIARLQIDTGASGLVISRSVANRAGLKQFSDLEAGGIGSEGRKAAYTAFADDIKIGSLEFRDCGVRVIDSRNVVDSDGLIGMDVFSRFLITLDYPMRKLLLAPLPARPGDASPAKPALETAGAPGDNAPANTPEAQPAPKPAQRRLYDRYIAPEMKDWTPVYRIGHTLLIPASLNGGHPKIFILDSGAFATTISPDAAREVTKIHQDDRLQVYGISGRVDKVYSADTITFRFANVSQKAQGVVAFATTSTSKDLNMEISGLIGFTTLGQMTVSIDYRDGLTKFTYDPHRGFRYPQ